MNSTNAVISTSSYTISTPDGVKSKEVSVVADLNNKEGKMRVRERVNDDIKQTVQDLTKDQIEKISKREFVPNLICDDKSCRLEISDDGNLEGYRNLFKIKDMTKPKSRVKGRRNKTRRSKTKTNPTRTTRTTRRNTKTRRNRKK
jgi:hypothetical protein